MKIKFLLITAVLITAILFSAGSVKAINNSDLIAQLQAQIAQLLAQIKVLQTQQGATQAWCHAFNKNLYYGYKGEEVVALHAALDKEGITYGDDDSDTYNEGTSSAIVEFQEKYASEILAPIKLKHGTGNFGPTTRKKMNALYGCAISTTAPTIQSVIPIASSSGTGVLQRIRCETYPNSDKIDIETCRCNINQYKKNIAVILKQGGIFDNNEVKNSIKSYLSEASRSLNLTSSGIFMFSGETIEDLDELTELIYSNNNVEYIVIAGDDFPIYQNAEALLKVSDVLSYVGSTFSSVPYGSEMLGKCKDVAISLVPAPRGNDSLKKQFIKKVFDHFAELHANYDQEIGSYANNLLAIKWDPIFTSECAGGGDLAFDFARDYYAMPKSVVENSDQAEIQRIFRSQPLALQYVVHGSTQNIGLGINPDNLSGTCSKVYTSIDQYKTFLSSDNFKGPLFVDSNACGGVPIDWDYPGSYLDQNNPTKSVPFCCWPQAFLDSGSWAVFRGSGGAATMGSFIKYSTAQGNTLGEGILTIPHESFQIYGDILMHFPKNTTTQPSITVTSPNGGETWTQGQTYEIKWTSKGTQERAHINLQNYNSSSNIADQYIIANDYNFKDGSNVFSWKVPMDFYGANMVGNKLKIRVGGYSSSNIYTEDVSDNYFSVVAPVITAPATTYCSQWHAKFMASYQKSCGETGYDPVADVDKDKTVGLTDVGFYAANQTNETWCQQKLSETTSPCATSLNTNDSSLASISDAIARIIQGIQELLKK